MKFLLYSLQVVISKRTSGLIKGLVEVPADANFIGYRKEPPSRPKVKLDAKKITIGAVVDLSENRNNGGLSGLEAIIGFYYGKKEVEKRGLLGQMELELDIKNTDGSSGKCFDNAITYKENGYIGVIGAVSSVQLFSAAGLLNMNNTMVLSPLATSSEFENRKNFPFFLQLDPDDYDQTEAIVLVMKYFDWTLVSGLFSNDVYGISGHMTFLKAAYEHPIRPTCTWIMNGYQEEDVIAVAECLERSESSVLLLFMSAEQARTVVKYLYKFLKKKVIFVAPYSWGSFMNYKTGFARNDFPISYLDGMISVVPEAENDKKEDASILEFLNDEKNKARPYIEERLRCKITIDESIPICDPDINKRKIGKSGEEKECRCDANILKDVTLGSMAYFSKDCVLAYAEAISKTMNECKNAGNCNKAEIDGVGLYKTVSSNSFIGETGKISFTNNKRNNVKMGVYKYDSKTNEQTRIGEYQNGAVSIQKTEAPIYSQVRPTSVTASDVLGIVVIVISTIGIIFALWIGWFIYENKEEPVIRKASPIFCELIIFGAFLGYLSTIFWTLNQNKATCILRGWTLAIGFALIVGNLLAKTYRIFKIFTNVKVTSVVIKDSQLFLFSGVIVVYIVILMSVYTFGSPGLPDAVIVQSEVDTLYRYIRCYPPNPIINRTIVILLLSSCFVLAILGIVIAYLTRKVESSFNESKEILYTMYTFVLLACIVIPLYFTSGDSRGSVEREYILRSFSVLLGLFGALYFLFIPKILLAKAEKEERIREEGDATTGATTTTRAPTTTTTTVKDSQRPKGTEWVDENKGVYGLAD
eukprot:GHVP01019970.1.p1 GENE.GHVP01019970.1~~GHVP01019970.1.p1  ORF type:complete len:813 (+),score=136.53 GHVP01019970.1:67-2505(+)